MFAPRPLPRTLAAAIRDVGSAREDVRVSAIRDLVRHADGSPEVRAQALPLLAEALSDKAPMVRATAAVALADLSAIESLPALLFLVDDDDPYVRQMAIRSLGELRDPRAKGRLLRALNDERADVRYQAVVAYVRIAEDVEEVVEAVAKGLVDEDHHIRTISLRVADERAEREDQRAALEAALVPLVRSMLSSLSRPDALTAALFLLGHGARDDAALTLVRKAVQGELKAAPPEDVNEAFIVAGELGQGDLIPLLERRLFGLARWLKPDSLWHVRVGLVLLGHERATQSVLDDIVSRDPAKRHAAVLAAGRARLQVARPSIEALVGTDYDAVAQRALTLIDAPTNKGP